MLRLNDGMFAIDVTSKTIQIQPMLRLNSTLKATYGSLDPIQIQPMLRLNPLSTPVVKQHL